MTNLALPIVKNKKVILRNGMIALIEVLYIYNNSINYSNITWTSWVKICLNVFQIIMAH